MNRVLLTILCVFLSITNVNAALMQGGVSTSQQVYANSNRIIDKTTRQPVANAKVTVPAKNYTTYTDNNGQFELNTRINTPTILSVEKANYKPFSVTVTQSSASRPFVLSLEKSNQFDIKIDSELCHLGDNNYSGYSANAGQFKSGAVGPVYKKNFYISSSANGKQYFLVIGSIIGIDTALARGMGQNNISNAFASPPVVYLNGQKIAEIQINGDNQKIRLPKNLIKWNQQNIITIKAGRNLMQTAYVDYDDIEFMNVSVQTF
ncbi:MAG: carboxypeptidase-like regulatory domain-containing protein [Candidatus Gastranaerophilales bacterium]|nr:carboxypeptidase-like regulatory domain-containing protein [Candidatus Gastranaerophilales bacterium]